LRADFEKFGDDFGLLMPVHRRLLLVLFTLVLKILPVSWRLVDPQIVYTRHIFFLVPSFIKCACCIYILHSAVTCTSAGAYIQSIIIYGQSIACHIMRKALANLGTSSLAGTEPCNMWQGLGYQWHSLSEPVVDSFRHSIGKPSISYIFKKLSLPPSSLQNEEWHLRVIICVVATSGNCWEASYWCERAPWFRFSTNYDPARSVYRRAWRQVLTNVSRAWLI
jgi:hypothetical protein